MAKANIPDGMILPDVDLNNFIKTSNKYDEQQMLLEKIHADFQYSTSENQMRMHAAETYFRKLIGILQMLNNIIVYDTFEIALKVRVPSGDIDITPESVYDENVSDFD